MWNMPSGQEQIIKRNIRFLDLRIKDEELLQQILSSIKRILVHGPVMMGQEVVLLEERVATYCGRKYGVGVGSGTDALFLGLKALGIGPGDEVITTPLSWIATANAIVLTGATPVFADIDDDLNIDPGTIEKLITDKTKAILPVHFTGKICRIIDIQRLADKYGLMVIEDASQAFGASYRGKKAGSFGIISCFSMNPMKVFGASGEAGMILTDREDIYEKLKALRHNGMLNKTECIEISLNGRMDTIQAAVLLHRLEYIDEIIYKRRKRARWYKEMLEGVVTIPEEREEEFDIYYTYTIKTPKRDELMEFLHICGIETQIQHRYLMPDQPAYRKWAKGYFPKAKRLVRQILSLPVNETLSRDDIEYVAGCIKRFVYGGK